jgi:L-alanine-DL-glutamate epimerase-like enolase superfamily enzyme
MECRILEARVTFAGRPFRAPLRISSGVISEVTEARAEVRVRLEGGETTGCEATGRGATYLSDLWAWPEPSLTHAQRDAALRRFSEELAARLPDLCGGAAHPLELGLRLHHAACALPAEPDPSVLARAMCASPFDAALHDAAGIALGRSAFDLYEEPVRIPAADPLFRGGACAAVRRILRPAPLRELAAWLIVGPHDSLEDEVGPWVRERGYRCFKLKILGDPAADAAFTAEVFRAVGEMGAREPRLCADPNGAYSGPEQAVEYLERLRALDAAAFAAFEYLEQPTGREIAGSPHDWRAPARLKPVLLDEGLTGLEALEEARAQGWSGFALKTCKGQSFALLAAAWAAERGMAVTLQDLTNPGLALIHAALFAARVPTLNGVELNSPQFTPAANEEWLPRLKELFEPQDGRHRLPEPLPAGLGSDL